MCKYIGLGVWIIHKCMRAMMKRYTSPNGAAYYSPALQRWVGMPK